ncbi:MAG: hypothetical protein B6229_10600 [Spirochaetaceae bacterium 4572_7]|nr:MAG: hypothetical protein B6229_10600 [Spirochaetaceae bacterium 4572_7]
MFDFIEEGYQEGDKVWNMLFQQWETITQIIPNIGCSITTDKDIYTSKGYGVNDYITPIIYPNKFELTIPDEAYETPLKDKDFVECWDNNSTFNRSLRFYDARNKCSFSGRDGCRGGFVYDNYKRVPMPDWAKAIKDKLED